MTGPHADGLHELAKACGVATAYEAAGRRIDVPERTLRVVLKQLGYPADDHATATESLRKIRELAWTRPVEPVSVVWQGTGVPARHGISAPDGGSTRAELMLEDGSRRGLGEPRWRDDRRIAGTRRRRGRVVVPADLPPGYHRLVVGAGDERASATVIVAPQRCPDVGERRHWGWLVQSYALRSRSSWGQGEFTDVAAFSEWSAERGAAFVLTNPVHAPAPVLPQEPSPYYPSSRRFFDPRYLRIVDAPGFADLPADDRARIRRLGDPLTQRSDRIDRDRIWRAKSEALGRIFAGMSPARRSDFEGWRAQQGEPLERFATFCAIAEEHGVPFQGWPGALQDPGSGAVTRYADANAERVAFHAWLQLACREQLAAAQSRARAAGMAIGILHDLAVGVDRGGADAWALPDDLARGVSVGAPPDAFNPQGQNWAQPPFLPGRLRETGHRLLRDLLRAVLAHAGGIRIDHILGLYRLFWIPDGARPDAGTYVRYPDEELFAVLSLEANRAGAVVVGEDLGTPAPQLRTLMRNHGVLTSAVLYFESGSGRRRQAQEYPRDALASVNTHDLPTATAWWQDVGPADSSSRSGGAQEVTTHAERTSMEALLRDAGMLQPGACVWQRVLAMHRFLASTPSALVAGSVWDAVGDERQPNLPGPRSAYPSWCLPLAEPTSQGPRPVTLEDLMRHPRVSQVIEALRRPT